MWRKLGSIHLTVVLCLSLAADLTWGYVCLNRHATLFGPLNDIGLAAWLHTYGRHNMAYTAWFFLLLALLTLLCINTFVCTTDRVAGLLRARRRFTSLRLFFKFAPHIMHYALIVILAGYLSSYLFARVLDTRTLVPGHSMTLPATTARITFTGFDPLYHRGDHLPVLRDRVLRPRARLLLTDGESRQSTVLCCNRPVRFKGYGIFLKDFSPKQKGGAMAGRARIDMSIRKDPGVVLYLAGLLLFTAGLAIYLVDWTFFKKIRKDPL